jgi:hypothetical protein
MVFKSVIFWEFPDDQMNNWALLKQVPMLPQWVVEKSPNSEIEVWNEHVPSGNLT